MKRTHLPLISIAMCLVIASAGKASTQRIEATYNFVWKNMLVSTAETTTEINENSYKLHAEMRMRGLAKLFMGGGKTLFSAHGFMAPDGSLQPQEYRSSGKWKGKPYHESLSYDQSGNLTGLVKDWPIKWREENRREPVPAALQTGHDPASLLVALIRQPLPIALHARDNEPFVFQVFDGDTVVSWSINCAALPVLLKKSKHSKTFGEAHECTLVQHLVAGQRILTAKQKAKEDKRLKKKHAVKSSRKRKAQYQYDGPLKVWMQPMGDSAYWIPVRALVPSKKGTVRVYLKDMAMAGIKQAGSTIGAMSR